MDCGRILPRSFLGGFVGAFFKMASRKVHFLAIWGGVAVLICTPFLGIPIGDGLSLMNSQSLKKVQVGFLLGNSRARVRQISGAQTPVFYRLVLGVVHDQMSSEKI